MRLVTKVTKLIEKTLSLVNLRVGNLVAIMLMAMVLLAVADIILRRIFNSPLPFSYELTGLILVVAAYFSVAYSSSLGRHVSIEALVSRFPPKVRAITNTVTDFLSAGLFGVIAWRSIVRGMHVWDIGQISPLLKIPHYPFLFVIALGTALACIAILVRVINSIIGDTRA